MSRGKSFKSECLIHDSDYVRNNAGRNIIPEPESEPLWKVFLAKFKDPIIVILLVVWALSMGISAYEILVMGKSASCLIEPVGIFIAILLATGIAFILEVNAEKEFKILNKKKDERPVRVMRWRTESDAKSSKKRPAVFQIKRCDVVKGDVVMVESGDEIPADGVLLEALTLRIDESNYTGEPYTMKMVVPDPSLPETTYPRNFLLRGTTVLEGNALYRVTATGEETEEGKGADTLKNEPVVETPLNRQLDQLAHGITVASYIVAGLIVVGRLLFYFIHGYAENGGLLDIAEFTLKSVMLAVTLIVVAVPEGLPMSVTISLALSMKKMLRQNNLVRKLHACETLGAATVICTDKTGTLTKNRMRVAAFEHYYPDPRFVAQTICVNSTAELAVEEDGNDLKTVGNPTEGAILYFYAHPGDHAVDYEYFRENATILEQVPFSAEKKYMMTTATDDLTGKKYRYLKGAPEVVLSMCRKVGDGTAREVVVDRLHQLQERGMRTLGLAFQDLTEGDAGPMTYIGTVAIQDPIRDDVREAIYTCRSAGVRVIMITGDVAGTANEIAREAGILDADEQMQTITGAEFAGMKDEEIIHNVLPSLKVLSRARPEDKLRLVSLLQATGEVVAVTGDGTNDALALKKAQVGLSMGDGTSRAKEASDITIIDNSFSSINKGILWGRSLYMNIKRFILFQMTINLCACLVVLLGAFLGLDSPLTVAQMLWVNLIMDTFAAVALSTLPPDEKVMRMPPRNPAGHIIDRTMSCRILLWGCLFFVFLVALWQLLWHVRIDPDQGVSSLYTKEVWQIFHTELFSLTKEKAHLSGYELGIFFTTFVLLQFWNLFNARYYRTGRSLLGDLIVSVVRPGTAGSRFSLGFLVIVAVILAGQFAIVNLAGEFFEVAPLSFSDWMYLLCGTSLVLVIPDLWRFFRFLAAASKK